MSSTTATKTSAQPSPFLAGIDQGYRGTFVPFQFAPQNVSIKSSGEYSSTSSIGRTNPVLQFVSTENSRMSFTAVFAAMSVADDASIRLRALLNAVNSDIKLGRPPLWRFIWGSFIDETVFVESLDVTQLRLFPDTGSIGTFASVVGSNPGGLTTATLGLLGQGAGRVRYAEVSVNLLVYKPYNTAIQTSPLTVKRNTFFHFAQRGDTWEKLALKYYGDPMKGEILRRENPTILDIEPGQMVVILKEANIRSIPIVPTSIAFRNTRENLENRRYWTNKRAIARFSRVLPKE